MGVDDDDDDEENFDSDESMWSLPVRGDDASVSATRARESLERSIDGCSWNRTDSWTDDLIF
jgi:hypothetical protein